MEITLNVVREKIRKKMLYVTTIVGILIVSVFSSGMGSLTIGGKNIKDYYVMVPILINIVNFLAGAIALAMSVTTVPDEYERRTSHLIWSRGVSQNRYHFSLAAGNVLVSWISGLILYGALVIFAIMNGYPQIIGTLVAATFFMMLYTAIICLITTALSIKLPPVFAGTIMILILVGGAFRSMLTLFTAAFTGIGGMITKRALLIIPNLAGISKQAGNLVQGKPVNVHEIIIALIVIWIAGLGILLLKREEA